MAAPKRDEDGEGTEKLSLVDVNELRGEDAESTCLRPLGLCDLGACDVCWYRPDHPRFSDE